MSECDYSAEVEMRRAESEGEMKILPAARVVGQDAIITEIYGITTSKPGYIDLVRCM